MKNLLLKGGRIVDPANHRDEIGDLLVVDGRIDQVGVVDTSSIGGDYEEIDCTGRLVLPGLIDTHSHVYQYVSGRFGLNADLCGVRSGVTTLVDQGGASCMTIPGFRKFIVESSASRVIPFISAYLVGGLEGHFYPELYRPECSDVDATLMAIEGNRDIVRGIKAHAELGGFNRWGVSVMEKAAEIGRRSDLPVYIHFGQLWPLPEEGGSDVDPDTILSDVVKLLKPGDILAHPFSRHPGGFVTTTGKLHPLVKEAVAKGLKVDVGHGSHFSYETARIVLEEGVLPDTLGSDMHGYNTSVPCPSGTPDEHPDEGHLFKGAVKFSLTSAMTSMLALGVPFDHVVRMVTTNAARMLGMEGELGTLSPGAEADISVLADERGQWQLRDNEGTRVVADRLLAPLFCVKSGVLYEADADILPEFMVA
ncbi:amidohydrolase/deacetylase family metallohydrolase [Marinobacter salinexigens]|uniref:Amidohydrolase/deacetylase family metallohydrolase n=1 Tax=Marinobacter salinexigens TaxID=2919747 RepID=A0A5B0VFQ4_9GAMM|nr:amidohydrolase/deacetylase family metallohydrolase [Marinobacter salinexigens]KAA1172879.1 amidohydrolase/deacetylase family metallohydrolase [Marinobacter salinexigens]